MWVYNLRMYYTDVIMRKKLRSSISIPDNFYLEGLKTFDRNLKNMCPISSIYFDKKYYILQPRNLSLLLSICSNVWWSDYHLNTNARGKRKKKLTKIEKNLYKLMNKMYLKSKCHFTIKMQCIESIKSKLHLIIKLPDITIKMCFVTTFFFIWGLHLYRLDELWLLCNCNQSNFF